jgi:hypothetical protein
MTPEREAIERKRPESHNPKHLAARLAALRKPVITSVSMPRRAKLALARFAEVEKLGASELIRKALAELAVARANAALVDESEWWLDIAAAFGNEETPS